MVKNQSQNLSGGNPKIKMRWFAILLALVLVGSTHADDPLNNTAMTSRARGMFSPEQGSETGAFATLSPFVHNAKFDTDEIFRRARTRQLAEVARISLAKLGASAVDDSYPRF